MEEIREEVRNLRKMIVRCNNYKAAIAQGIMKEGESTDTRFGMFFIMIPKRNLK